MGSRGSGLTISYLIVQLVRPSSTPDANQLIQTIYLLAIGPFSSWMLLHVDPWFRINYNDPCKYNAHLFMLLQKNPTSQYKILFIGIKTASYPSGKRCEFYLRVLGAELWRQVGQFGCIWIRTSWPTTNPIIVWFGSGQVVQVNDALLHTHIHTRMN